MPRNPQRAASATVDTRKLLLLSLIAVRRSVAASRELLWRFHPSAGERESIGESVACITVFMSRADDTFAGVNNNNKAVVLLRVVLPRFGGASFF